MDDDEEFLKFYATNPPGPDMAVCYVATNIVNGKEYVGQHRHGLSGKSVQKARWNSGHKGCAYFEAALKKYGRKSFEWKVIWHGNEEEVDEAEENLISAKFRNTLAPNGYNIRKGGASAGLSEIGIQRNKAAQKLAQNRPEVRRRSSETAKAQALKAGKRSVQIVAMLSESSVRKRKAIYKAKRKMLLKNAESERIKEQLIIRFIRNDRNNAKGKMKKGGKHNPLAKAASAKSIRKTAMIKRKMARRKITDTKELAAFDRRMKKLDRRMARRDKAKQNK